MMLMKGNDILCSAIFSIFAGSYSSLFAQINEIAILTAWILGRQSSGRRCPSTPFHYLHGCIRPIQWSHNAKASVYYAMASSRQCSGRHWHSPNV